jgi:hypothetical protein
VLHHLPTAIVQSQHPYLLNSTSQPNQFISLHTHNITPLFGAGGLNSLLATTQGLAHTFAQCLEYPGATQGQTVVSMNHHPQKSHHSTPQPRSLLPPPLRELRQRQRQRRPQRDPIPKTLQPPQPLESQHHKIGEGRRL